MTDGLSCRRKLIAPHVQMNGGLMNLFCLLDHAARRYAERDAVFLGERPILTFASLRQRALALAAAITERSKRGDRILVFSGNCPEYFEILFGTWAAGRVVVPVNFKLHAREVRQIIEDAEPAFVFASPDLARALADAQIDVSVVQIGSPAYQKLLNTQISEPAHVAPDDLAWIFFTSGTTGRSKGAMLSHRNLLAMAIAHLADIEDIRPDHTLIHAAPMSHGSGLYILPYIARGARQCVPDSKGFDPDLILDLCGHHSGCGMFLAPTMVNRLRQAAETRTTMPKQLRSIVYGGGPMYLEDLRAALQVFGPILAQIYGQGEAPMTITGCPAHLHSGADDALLASVGWPRSGMEVRIVDETGSPLLPGSTGEIQCRGDLVMSGYWKNPAATEAALSDGWLMTGDRGMMDETYRLTLKDRSKDMIISGGTNIYPREVEEVLLQHPDVTEACIVGETDSEWGEIVVAHLVLTPSACTSPEELDAHCMDRIARFKRPKKYHFHNELPKNAYGKILKRELVRLEPSTVSL